MAATDDYKNSPNPADECFAITPSDSTQFSTTARGIYVGVSGDVVAVTPLGTAITFKNALQGTVIPVRCIRVNSTNTTATNLVGLL